jgi:hypothetical protein
MTVQREIQRWETNALFVTLDTNMVRGASSLVSLRQRELIPANLHMYPVEWSTGGFIGRGEHVPGATGSGTMR